jgi:tetratricopeptide (TPR) repeat protein
LQSLLRRARHREGLDAARQLLDSAAPAELCESVAVALRDYAESHADRTSAVFEEMYRAIIDLQRKAHGEDGEPVWVAWWSLADFLDKRGRIDDAKRAYQAMIAVAEKLAGSEPALLERAQSRYADLLGRTGDLSTAEQLLRQAIRSMEQDGPARKERESRMGKKGPDLREVLSDLHKNLLRQGKVDEANLLFAVIALI